ncbi:DUF3870 domain-containing protein [Aneurinibacillus sp. BA2021]|nr:DUF3870 domain-containing protein [Aneurinibacillus sp. BA2021]
MNTEKKNQILVAGFAQLPKGTPIYEMQKTIACVLIVDKESAVITQASFSFIMDITRDYIRSLVEGRSIKNGIEHIVKDIEDYFHVPPQRAVIQSLRSAYERYVEAI